MWVRKSCSILALLSFVLVSFSAASADVTTGLVAHWMLDDGAGAIATDSVGGNDGTLQGDATWAEGYVGGAILLDGDGDYVDCGNKEAFNVTDAVTLAAWIQADGAFAYPDWSGIIMRGGPNIDTFALYYNGPSKQMGFKTTGTTPNWYATASGAATAIFDGEWHHTAAAYDGAMKRVYVDGVEVGSVAATGKIETSTGRLLLGAGRDLNPPTHFVAGRIDEARLYSRALVAKDVKELMPPKLQAYGPDPADGAVGVMTPLFRWKSGDTAVFHNLYLGKDPNLGADDLAAERLVQEVHWHQPGIEPGVVYYWRVDEVELDGTTIHTGNVWSFITQALTAYHPQPADGAVDVSPTPALTWLPGQAAIEHRVYFSGSFDDVNDRAAAADRGIVKDTTFAPGDLESVARYYWCVDETMGGITTQIQPGPVWSFTTYLPVDDFESYTEDLDASEAIWQVWIDGVENGTGSTVGYWDAPFTEQTIVHGGLQSMPYDYNNIVPPHYSEAEREFDGPQDWTLNGANTLVFHLRGQPKNDAAQVYVALQDTSNHSAVVGHPDPNVVLISKWNEWRIPLSEFSEAGVNAARIKALLIGVGDRENPTPDGRGLIFIDDIYVIRAEAVVTEE